MTQVDNRRSESWKLPPKTGTYGGKIDVTKSANMFVFVDALFFLIFIGGLSSNHESQVNNNRITRHNTIIW